MLSPAVSNRYTGFLRMQLAVLVSESAKPCFTYSAAAKLDLFIDQPRTPNGACCPCFCICLRAPASGILSAVRCRALRNSSALELAVWELRLGLLQAVLLLLVLPVVDNLCRLIQQQHLVPAHTRSYRTLKTCICSRPSLASTKCSRGYVELAVL